MARAPGVVTGRYGTVGEVFLQKVDYWPLNTTLWVSDFHGNDERFVYYLLQRVDFAKHSGKSGVPGVNRNDLHTEFVVLPASRVEQRRVAAVLEGCDQFIDALERLIAKKQAIKQGIMEQLLTGTTRLPGFAEPWSTATLGMFGTFLKGRGVKRDDVRPAGIPCIRYGELYTAFNDYTSGVRSFVEPEIAATALPLRSGDLLFAGSGETRDEIGKCVAYVGKTPAVAGGDIVVLRGSPELFNAIYLALLANSPDVVDQKSRAGQGDAVVHISSRALAAVEVRVPQRPEQDAIAKALTTTEFEIATLRARLVKAKAVKVGVMQQLLTGRTRIPIAGSTE